MKRVVAFRTGERDNWELVRVNGVYIWLERLNVKAARTVDKWTTQLGRYVDAFVACDIGPELYSRLVPHLPEINARLKRPFVADGECLRRVLERRAIFAAWNRGWIAAGSVARVLDSLPHPAATEEFALAGVRLLRAGSLDDADADVLIGPVEQALGMDVRGKLLLCDRATRLQLEQLADMGLAHAIVLTPQVNDVSVTLAELEAMLAVSFERRPPEFVSGDWEYALNVLELRQGIFDLNQYDGRPGKRTEAVVEAEPLTDAGAATDTSAPVEDARDEDIQSESEPYEATQDDTAPYEDTQDSAAPYEYAPDGDIISGDGEPEQGRPDEGVWQGDDIWTDAAEQPEQESEGDVPGNFPDAHVLSDVKDNAVRGYAASRTSIRPETEMRADSMPATYRASSPEPAPFAEGMSEEEWIELEEQRWQALQAAKGNGRA